MDLQLRGKHVLITGGTRGIGLACAAAFLEEGAKVSVCGRHGLADSAREAQPGRHAISGFACDLTSWQAALHVVERVELEQGPIDILVNSAGAAIRRPFAELDASSIRG